ncbi:MAG TPA: hypothetical protein VGA49_01015 [Patescibacteria group bacterium]
MKKYTPYIFSGLIILIFIILTILLLNIPINEPPTLLERVSGRILIQVMDEDQVWYIYPGRNEVSNGVYPKDQKRYLLAENGFEVLKSLAVKLENIDEEKKYPGHIVTYDQREYIYLDPVESKKYKFNDQQELLEVIEQVGLGAYNRDLKRIESGVE